MHDINCLLQFRPTYIRCSGWKQTLFCTLWRTHTHRVEMWHDRFKILFMNLTIWFAHSAQVPFNINGFSYNSNTSLRVSLWVQQPNAYRHGSHNGELGMHCAVHRALCNVINMISVFCLEMNYNRCAYRVQFQDIRINVWLHQCHQAIGLAHQTHETNQWDKMKLEWHFWIFKCWPNKLTIGWWNAASALTEISSFSIALRVLMPTPFCAQHFRFKIY